MVEDRIRSTLSRSLSALETPEGAWSAIERRVGRRRRGAVVVRVVAASALLLGSVGLVVWLGGALTSGPRPIGPARQLGPGPSAPVSPRLAATVPVGPTGQTSSLVFGAGSLWVSSYGSAGGDGVEPGVVHRIDPATNDGVATIPVEAVPTWEVGGEGMAAGAGAIWVTGATGELATLVRIDPSTNRVTATIDLPAHAGGDVAVASSGVWVSAFVDPGLSSVAVIRVDPTTNRVVATIPVEGDWIREVFAVDGAVVTRSLSGDSRVLTVIDPSSNRVAIARTLPGAPDPFAEGDGVVWAGRNTELLRIDSQTGLVIGDPIPLGRSVGGASIAVGEGGVWFVGYDPDDASPVPTVDRFNPETGRVDASIDAPEDAIALATGPETVWVLGYEGSVTRIDLR